MCLMWHYTLLVFTFTEPVTQVLVTRPIENCSRLHRMRMLIVQTDLKHKTLRNFPLPEHLDLEIKHCTESLHQALAAVCQLSILAHVQSPRSPRPYSAGPITSRNYGSPRDSCSLQSQSMGSGSMETRNESLRVFVKPKLLVLH